MSNEAVVQQQVRLALARMGAQAWRNNTGACTDDTGRLIRYGLCNESAQMNAQIKSSDLICIVPITIQPYHVGRTLGIFTAIECKKSGWHLTPGDKRGQAQKRFIDIVHGVGGIGGFATGPEDLAGILMT
jgi:hypothetical protein